MKRLIIVALFFVGFAHATTSVTGKIQTLGTSNITSGAFARFWLRGCGGNQPRINGTATIGPSQGGVFYFDISADSGGNVTGTIYSTRDATGLLGGEIECGGSKLSVWYGLQIFVAGKGGPESPVHAKNAATLDITQVNPITTNPVVTSPTGDSTYARLDGGNQPFTGNITPSGNGTLNMGTSTNRWKLFVSTLDASSTLNVGGSSTLSGTAINGPFTVAGNSTFTVDSSGNVIVGISIQGVPSLLLRGQTTNSPNGTATLQGGQDNTLGGGNAAGLDAIVAGGIGVGAAGLSGGNVRLTPGASGTGTPGDVIINRGIANDTGTGFKHKRVTGCTTGSTSGNTCTTTVTWTTAFADANYTPVCILLGPSTLGHLAAISTDVIAAASVKVETVTDTNAAITGTINCIAVHD